jgi:thiol-disulfide isomerase/thioredoxin
MIKKILFAILLISGFLFAQDENLKAPIDSTGSKQAAQINKIIKSESGNPMLIGDCTREAFNDTSFSGWWMSEYDLYNVDSTSLKEIESALKYVNIKIVMGTWCSDSRREVPRFFKILDAVNYPSGKVGIICVDENKNTGDDELSELKIELVPTIIFSQNGNELGRIVEAPEDTLEKDMIKILKTHS